ncbi:hypothetical protein FOA52_009078 [Chlamydomonas sp. UWO 241]|nr:hypothetical protein FOA52_009078 [Chlamydomonas sp. UWO 241]
MPPLSRRDLRKLVRKLGVNARPGEQQQALETLAFVCRDGSPERLAALAAAGPIPELVQLLGPGFPTHVQHFASAALGRLVDIAGDALTAAGAIPPLVQLLGPNCAAAVQEKCGRNTGVPRSEC